MKIVLIRHVESEANTYPSFNGITESELTERGQLMKEILIDDLGSRVKDLEITKILSSPTERALTIAKDLSKVTEIPLEIVPVLQEYDFGIFDGLKVEEAIQQYPEVYDEWIHDHLHIALPEGDSYESKYKEVSEWIESYLKENKENLIIVSHGATIRCLLSKILNLPLDAGWHFDIQLGGYCLIDYNHNFGTLEEMTSPAYPEKDPIKFDKRFIK